MSTREKATIQQFKDLLDQQLITQYEYNWCVGAIRNRHELTAQTRHQLRDSVHEIIKLARSRHKKESQ